MVAISVCIPVWNDTRWLPRAIESVRAQTHDDWELIVGDNASTEDVRAVVEGFADDRVRIHRFQDHVDIFENFNRTCLLATKPWVHMLAADDRLDPACLGAISAAIERTEPTVDRLAMVATACLRLDPDGNSADHIWYGTKRKLPVRDGVYTPAAWFDLCLEDGQPPWNMGSVSVSRGVLHETGGFLRPEVGLSNDFEMAMRISAYGSVVYVDRPLLSFTVRSGSDGPARLQANRATGAPATVVEPAFLNALAVHDARRGVTAIERRKVKAAIARSHLQRAAQHRVLAQGRGRRGALVDVARAVRWSPRTVATPFHLAYGLASIIAPTRVLEAAKDRISTRLARGG